MLRLNSPLIPSSDNCEQTTGLEGCINISEFKYIYILDTVLCSKYDGHIFKPALSYVGTEWYFFIQFTLTAAAGAANSQYEFAFYLIWWRHKNHHSEV